MGVSLILSDAHRVRARIKRRCLRARAFCTSIAVATATAAEIKMGDRRSKSLTSMMTSRRAHPTRAHTMIQLHEKVSRVRASRIGETGGRAVPHSLGSSATLRARGSRCSSGGCCSRVNTVYTCGRIRRQQSSAKEEDRKLCFFAWREFTAVGLSGLNAVPSS